MSGATGSESLTAALTPTEALLALNTLRSNVVGTQNAGWSNTIYPFVAILNAAGMVQFDPSDDQLRQHVDCYGGAGGFPGHELREPQPGWSAPVGRLRLLTESIEALLEVWDMSADALGPEWNGLVKKIETLRARLR